MKHLTFIVVLICATVVLSIQDQYIVKNVVHEALTEKIEDFKRSSSTCAQHLAYMLNKNNIKQGWPIRMVDASSKIPSGLLSGNIADLGAFDQCLAIETKLNNKIIKGNYCKASVPLKKLMEIAQSIIKYTEMQTRGVVNINSPTPSITLAVCVPNSCSVEDLNKFLNLTVLGKDLNIHITNCQTSETEPFETGDYVGLTIFLLILVLIALSTAYDVYNYLNEKEPLHMILIAFSVYTNGRKLLTLTKNPNQLPCLHGIRFISMMWVIVGHTYYTAFYSPSINAFDTLSWMKEYSSMYILGATVSVDTFFVLEGLLITYVYLAAIDKGIKFNIINYYIHRYLRLTPALGMLVLLHVTILRFFGSGPYWPEIMNHLEVNCSKYWWSTLLYIQNYVNPRALCIDQSWYLSVDMQLYLLTPIVLLPLSRWPKLTMICLHVLVVISMIIPFTIAYIYEFRGLLSETSNNPDFMPMYYSNTYARFGPLVVGLVLGYYVYHRKTNIKLNSLFKNKIFNITGWILSLGTLVLIVFEPNNLYNHEYNKIESSIFVGVHRVVWSIALCWVIYACIIGQGGIINKFLSLSGFQILSRLTYSMYLVHLGMMTMKIGYLRVPLHFANYENMMNFWGDFVFTAVVGLIWTLAFESPMVIIEKILFAHAARKPKTPSNKITS